MLKGYYPKVPRLRKIVLLVRATCRLRQVWIMDGMLLTQKHRSTRDTTRPNATLSTTNPTRTARGSNTSFRGNGPAIGSVGHSTAYRNVNLIQRMFKISVLTSERTEKA